MSEPDPQLDDLSAFEAEATSHELPFGWRVLFWGLVVWGGYYLWAFTPALGGWSQAQDLEPSAGTEVNLVATIAFTVIPAVAAVVLVLRQRTSR